MPDKIFSRKVFSLVSILAMATVAIIAFRQVSFGAASTPNALHASFALLSQLDSLPPAPTSLESGFSEAAHKALAYIANRDGIPPEALTIASDHPTEYPALSRRFQVVALLDTRPEGEIYKLLVDLDTGQVEEDISALLAAEAQAHQARYGKLQPALYVRLQTLKDEAVLPVAVWTAAGSGQTLAEQQQAAFAALAAKYPEAKVALEHSGKPMDVTDPELARRIDAEYATLLSAGMQARTQPLVTELQNQRFTVITYAGMPSFTAVLPKRVILELSQRDDVSAIYLIEAEEQPALDSAVPTSLASLVWERGYDGSGVTIAVLEHGNIDPNNSFLHHDPDSRVADNGVQEHTTWVASCAASFHDIYRGMAPEATVLSAGENGQQADAVTALQWAVITQTADIVSFSGGFEADNNVNWTDRAFDYWACNRFRLLVKSAGNTGGNITSPGKGWNIIAVGAIEDNNTPEWSDDQMWASSAYINPVSMHNDREKPEVVAVGASINALGIGDALPPVPQSGTSFAAPQVAGLGALLIDRNASLVAWPEASRAIIMASATHNIEGPAIIVRGQGDLRDGAGAVNAALADTVAQLRGEPTSPCYTSCWWGQAITASSPPVGGDLERTFYAERGNLIRVVIAWWSNADTPSNNYSFDRLDTDLDLCIKDPNGQWVSGASSLSFDNNYEMVQFFARNRSGGVKKPGFSAPEATLYTKRSLQPAVLGSQNTKKPGFWSIP